MKFRKLTAMLLSVSLVAGLAATCAFADDTPPDAAPGGDMGDGGGSGGSAGFTLPEGQLSVWIKDGVVVEPDTDGAKEYKVDRIVTSNEDAIGSFTGGGTTEEDDDYAYVTAVYVKDGKLQVNQSVAEAIASGADDVTDEKATGIVINSEYEGFNPIIVVDSNYTISGANITIKSDGDGSKTCDFSGLGAAIAAYGDETLLVIEDSTVAVSGVANLTVFADNGADVVIKNSTLSSDGGTLYAGYKNSPDQATMVAPPWILGIMGTSRCTNLMGTDSSTTVIDSNVSAAQWAVLSTDSGSNMKLNVVNTTMALTGAAYVIQNDETFGTEAGNVSNPYTTRAGYGTYAIGDADEYFYGVDMEVGTYATIFTGGKGTYTSLTKDQEITLTNANGETVETYVPAEDKVTTINSDTFGFMIHQSSNELTVEKGTVVNSGYTTFLLKSGASNANVTANITSGAQLNPGNGILIQVMDNDDTTTGMDVSTFSFYTTHNEQAGWHAIGNGVASDQTSTFNFEDVTLVGDIFNASGYESDNGTGLAPTTLDVNLSGSTTLTGMISSTDAIHVTKDGSDAIAAAAAGEKASEDWVQYQNTSFDISHYYDIGQVANKVNYNGFNDINVTLTGDATWSVTGDGIVNNLTAKSDAITAEEDVIITVMGTLTLDGETIVGGKQVGHVYYVVVEDCTAPYSDLSRAGWYVDELHSILGFNYMNGTGDGKFSPNASISRQDLTTVVWRMAREPEAGEITFADASQVGSWAKTAVAWAAEEGIVSGTGNNAFSPNAAITRQDVAVILYNWFEGSTTDTSNLSKFSDSAQVADYAKDAMAWAVANGLFKGDDNGKLNPTSNISRIEAAVVLNRSFSLMP
jgi:hypothetical protein